MTVGESATGGDGELIGRLVRRDRWVVAAALLLITSLSWWYLVTGAGMNMGGMEMNMPMPWSVDYATLVFLMWWIMMVAMMVPSAAPMILLFGVSTAGIVRQAPLMYPRRSLPRAICSHGVCSACWPRLLTGCWTSRGCCPRR